MRVAGREGEVDGREGGVGGRVTGRGWLGKAMVVVGVGLLSALSRYDKLVVCLCKAAKVKQGGKRKGRREGKGEGGREGC